MVDIMEESGLNERPIFVMLKSKFYDNAYFILFLITLFGMFLRFYGLGSESLWLDEATSVKVAKQSLHSIIFVQNDFAHPPLFYSILHFSLMLGNSEFFVRLPSAIFGTLSLPLIYLVGASIFGKREGLISSMLLSLSVMHINYSQEGRSYSLMMLLVLLTVYLFILAYKDSSIIKWILFAISGSVLVYTHFFGFFIIGSIGIFYILDNFSFTTKKFNFHSTIKYFIMGMVTFTLLSLPIILWVIGELGYATGHNTWGMSQEGYFYNIFLNFSNYSTTLLVVYGLLMVIGISTRITNPGKWFSFISLWFFLPLISGYFLTGTMPFQPRYLLFIIVPFLLFISRGIVLISDVVANIWKPSVTTNKGKHKKPATNDTKNGTDKSLLLTVSIILFIAILSFSPLYSQYTTSQKNDWRVASSYIMSVSEPGDFIVSLPNYIQKPLNYYYNNSSDETIYGTVKYSEEDLSSYAQGKQRIWFVVTGDINAANPNGSAITWLNSNAEFTQNIMGIYIFTYPAQ
jgi:uncharacterized membrane protein